MRGWTDYEDEGLRSEGKESPVMETKKPTHKDWPLFLRVRG